MSSEKNGQFFDASSLNLKQTWFL